MLPIFPNFKKVELHDKDHIEIYTKRHLPYSDFNFTSLWSFNVQEKCEFSILNDNFVMKFQDYVTHEDFYTFLGHNEALATIITLLDHAKKMKIQPVLKLIPESSIAPEEREVRKKFDVQEDPDNHDYIFSLLEISELKGNKYYNQRNLVNRFKRKVQNFALRKIDLNDEKTQKNIEELVHTWHTVMEKDPEETATELKVIQRAIQSHKELNIISHGVYIDEKLVALSMNEVLYDKYAIAHFRKADTRYAGIYQYLEHETAKHLSNLGFHFLNFEQDLGLENLRRAKKSWNPVHFLRKYQISYK